MQTPIKYRPVTNERTLMQFKQYGSKQCRQLGEEDKITWTGKGLTLCTSVSQTFIYEGIPKNNFLYPEETELMKTLTAGKQKAVGSTWRLLQYCQLSDKNSRDILRDLRNFSQYVKSFMYLLHDFSLYPIDVLGSCAWETLAFTM
jgi:hypothetical protein